MEWDFANFLMWLVGKLHSWRLEASSVILLILIFSSGAPNFAIDLIPHLLSPLVIFAKASVHYMFSYYAKGTPSDHKVILYVKSALFCLTWETKQVYIYITNERTERRMRRESRPSRNKMPLFGEESVKIILVYKVPFKLQSDQNHLICPDFADHIC